MTSENPFSFFSEIYCINREARTDRWARCQEQFAKLGLTVTRFNAIEGGEKGCMLSHVNVIRDAYQKKHKRILVLEDDVQFLVTDMDYYRELFYFLEFQYWQLLYLGGNCTQKLKRKNSFLFSSRGILCAHAVAYNENILPVIITDARMGRIKVIDTYLLGRIQTRNRSYIANKFCITQRPDYSDIQKTDVNYTDIKEKFDKFTRNP